MKAALSLLASVAVAMLGLGCSGLPGQKKADSITVAPNDIADFNLLYGQNCAGCHGAVGRGGAAVPIGDPLYLAIASRDTLLRVTREGVSGTSMPAFAKSAGGMLTAKQIEIIVDGIRSRWGKPLLPGAYPPAYAGAAPGDKQRGAAVYQAYCARCHGTDGSGGARATSIVDPSFLALVSDQGLRSLIIVGRPAFGAPGWRGTLKGTPMTSQDISDVVAWLSAKRTTFPGQPFPNQPLAGELR